MTVGDDDWQLYQKLVLAQLAELKADVKHLEGELAKVNTSIVTLKIKSGVWGLVAGGLPVITALAIHYLKGLM